MSTRICRIVRLSVLWLVAAIVVSAAPAASVPQSPPSWSLASDQAALVDKYCVTCHNDRMKTGGLSLQNLAQADVPAHADVWERVARKLRAGEMPPQTVRARPDPQAADALATALETTIDRAAAAHPNPG